jgi:hypothetical protein
MVRYQPVLIKMMSFLDEVEYEADKQNEFFRQLFTKRIHDHNENDSDKINNINEFKCLEH